MAKFKIHKLVNSLPNPLSPDTIYLVRSGLGFDLYCTDSTGAISYTLNNYNVTNNETLSGNKNLSISDSSYQFLSSSSNTSVNLPQSNLAPYKEFYIINTGNYILEIKENNVSLNIFIKPNGHIKCYSDNTNWHIFLNI